MKNHLTTIKTEIKGYKIYISAEGYKGYKIMVYITFMYKSVCLRFISETAISSIIRLINDFSTYRLLHSAKCKSLRLKTTIQTAL